MREHLFLTTEESLVLFDLYQNAVEVSPGEKRTKINEKITMNYVEILGGVDVWEKFKERVIQAEIFSLIPGLSALRVNKELADLDIYEKAKDVCVFISAREAELFREMGVSCLFSKMENAVFSDKFFLESLCENLCFVRLSLVKLNDKKTAVESTCLLGFPPYDFCTVITGLFASDVCPNFFGEGSKLFQPLLSKIIDLSGEKEWITKEDLFSCSQSLSIISSELSRKISEGELISEGAFQEFNEFVKEKKILQEKIEDISCRLKMYKAVFEDLLEEFSEPIFPFYRREVPVSETDSQSIKEVDSVFAEIVGCRAFSLLSLKEQVAILVDHFFGTINFTSTALKIRLKDRDFSFQRRQIASILFDLTRMKDDEEAFFSKKDREIGAFKEGIVGGENDRSKYWFCLTEWGKLFVDDFLAGK